jgi:hypothetical protein
MRPMHGLKSRNSIVSLIACLTLLTSLRPVLSADLPNYSRFAEEHRRLIGELIAALQSEASDYEKSQVVQSHWGSGVIFKNMDITNYAD